MKITGYKAGVWHGTDVDKHAFDAWLASRPSCVRELAAEFTPGSEVELDNEWHWIVGYTEGDDLILSPVSPADDYDAAMAQRVFLCAVHVRPFLPA